MQKEQDTFRHVIGHFASGVTVLTTTNGGLDYGATASAVASLSLDPPMLLVCLNMQGSTQAAIRDSGRFVVNILDEDQGMLAERFASPRRAKFDGLHVERGKSGVPVLADSLAYCECNVAEQVVAGTHRVFLADVTRTFAREGSPLTYFRGKFGRFEVEQDRACYGELRTRILARDFPLGASLDVGALAKNFDTLPATIYHAVTKLVADGLLARDPERGYVVKPVTVETSRQALDARCAIEVGVAVNAVGRVDPQRVSEIRALLDRTAPIVSAGDRVDFEAYSMHNEAFHQALVDLADNPTLTDSYVRLGVSGLLVSIIERSEAGRPDAHGRTLAPAAARMIDDHREIVAAYERGRLEDVMIVIRRHTARIIETSSIAIAAAGGEV